MFGSTSWDILKDSTYLPRLQGCHVQKKLAQNKFIAANTVIYVFYNIDIRFKDSCMVIAYYSDRRDYIKNLSCFHIPNNRLRAWLNVKLQLWRLHMIYEALEVKY